MRYRLPIALLLLSVSILAQAGDLDWLSADTDHFTIVFRERHRYAANEVLAFAEEVYDEVTGFLGAAPDHVPVVLFGETDLANGYYSPAPPQHIGLYIAQPTLPFLGARTDSWLRALFVHELVHFVHANYRPGLFYTVGSILGRSITGLSLGLAPGWHTEGLAVNAETILTSGGRGRDPFFEMTYKAPTVENRLFSLNQAGYDSYRAPAGRYYTAGYFIWDYLIERYGEEYVVELSRAVARFPLLGIWGPVRRTSGTRMREHYDAISADLIRRYAEEARAEPLERASPPGRGDYYLPTLTDRGVYLYRTRPDARPAIVRFDPTTGDEDTLLEMRLTDEASWSVTADGRTIAFATVDADATLPDELDIDTDLYLFDVDGGELSPLTTRGGYHHPAIAPDGGFLVAVRSVNGYHELVRFDLGGDPRDAGGTPLRFFAADRSTLYAPSVSPDGARVAVAVNQRGVQQIAVVDLETTEVELLRQPAGGLPYFPSFIDEHTLLYGSDRDGSLALYRHDLRSQAVERVATDPVGAFAGELSEDRLLVSVYTSDGYALRSAPAPVSGERVPTTPPRPLETIAAPQEADASRYVPLPAPAFWVPLPTAAGPGLNPRGWGAGPLVYGADYFARNAWQLAALYYPGWSQFDYLAAWQTRYGPLAWSLLAESSYSVGGDLDGMQSHAKVFEHGGTVTYALLARQALGVTKQVSARIGVTNTLAYASDTPIAVGGTARGTARQSLNRIVTGADLYGSRRPFSSERAFHAPGAASGSVSTAVPFDAPGFAPRTLLTVVAGSANLGLGRSDHVVALAPRLTYSTASAYASPVDLRGFGSRTAHARSADPRGAWGLDVDFRTRHILVDLPLAPSVGITSLGFGLFAEATGAFDLAPAGAGLDPAVGFGGEFTTVFTYWVDLPVTAGVALRVRPGDPSSFSFPDDVTFYLEAEFFESIPRLPQYLAPER